MKYEIFYSTGGHGGPFKTKAEAVVHAERSLRGNRNESWVKIVPYSEPWESTPRSKIHTLAGETIHRATANGSIPSWDREEFLDAAARALWVQAWADAAEERGESFGGGTDLTDVAPETPAEAKTAARAMAAKLAKLNGPLPQLWRKAASAQGKHYSAPTVKDFGHYLAMTFVGHGVSWEDDHPDIGIKVPHGELYVFYNEDTDEYEVG